MSTARRNLWLPDVISALITNGAPRFGRETTVPIIKTVPVGREGTVKLGPLEIKDDEVSPGR